MVTTTENTPEILETSVLLDHFTTRQLTAKSGYSPEWWGEMIVKELTDNGIDASESAGTLPEIKIEVTGEHVAVSDNGPGIPESTIHGACDYSKRVSSKARRPIPTRGSQGEALKQCFAVPYVLHGADGTVEIVTRGRQFSVSVRTDQVEQRPKVVVTNGATSVKNGTSVKVLWPELASRMLTDEGARFLPIATGFAVFNPHLAISADTPQGTARFTATNPGWQKWLPTFRSSAHWWTSDDLTGYIGALISKDRRTGASRTVRDLIGPNR
ncbi:MAG: ATP-binding protein [Pirellulaceae bacterium]